MRSKRKLLEEWVRLDDEIIQLETDLLIAKTCQFETRTRDYSGHMRVLQGQICKCINKLSKEITARQNEKQSIEQQLKNCISKQKGKSMEM